MLQLSNLYWLFWEYLIDQVYVLNWPLGISSVSECLSNDYSTATRLYQLILMEFEINLLGTKTEARRVWIFIALSFKNLTLIYTK